MTRYLLSHYVLLVVAILFWAGNFVVGRAIYENIPPMALSFWRWTVAGLVLLPFTAVDVWCHRTAFVRHWRLMIMLAFTGVVIYHTCTYLALNTTTAINVGLIYATAPVLIPTMSYFLHRQLVMPRQMIGIVISLVGMVTIITRADAGVLADFQFTAGDLWMVVAITAFSLYSPLLRMLPDGLPAMATLMVIIVLGVAIMAPLYAWEFTATGAFEVNEASLSSILFVALFPSLISYICWNRGVAEVGANTAGQFVYLIPVFTAVLAVGFLGEELRFFHYVGTALIFAGIYLYMSALRAVAAPVPRSFAELEALTAAEEDEDEKELPPFAAPSSAVIPPAVEPLEPLARHRPRPHFGSTKEPGPFVRLRLQPHAEPKVAPTGAPTGALMVVPVDQPPKPGPEPEDGDVLQLTPKMSFSEDSRVVSAPTSSQSADVLAALARVHDARRDLSVGARSATFDGAIKDMLRPMLTEWLECNLPALMERLVKKELDFMVRRDRVDDLKELERRKTSPRPSDER
jgi:drug/metabolite transporter (DMT)-like permease/cell pole-organizing protein PopZ